MENTQRFINEAFDNSTGTNADSVGIHNLGLYTKFSLNLINVALPNLIAPEIVMTHPMSSMSGYLNYVQFVAGSDKGQTSKGDVFNDPFRLGDVNPNYTSSSVVENVTATTLTPAWTPVVKGVFEDQGTKYDVKVVAANGTITYKNLETDGTITGLTAGDKVAYIYDNIVIPQNDLPILNARIASMPLLARARRIAIYYSK